MWSEDCVSEDPDLEHSRSAENNMWFGGPRDGKVWETRALSIQNPTNRYKTHFWKIFGLLTWHYLKILLPILFTKTDIFYCAFALQRTMYVLKLHSGTEKNKKSRRWRHFTLFNLLWTNTDDVMQSINHDAGKALRRLDRTPDPTVKKTVPPLLAEAYRG